jgi:hypothetical protein
MVSRLSDEFILEQTRVFIAKSGSEFDPTTQYIFIARDGDRHGTWSVPKAGVVIEWGDGGYADFSFDTIGIDGGYRAELVSDIFFDTARFYEWAVYQSKLPGRALILACDGPNEWAAAAYDMASGTLVPEPERYMDCGFSLEPEPMVVCRESEDSMHLMLYTFEHGNPAVDAQDFVHGWTKDKWAQATKVQKAERFPEKGDADIYIEELYQGRRTVYIRTDGFEFSGLPWVLPNGEKCRAHNLVRDSWDFYDMDEKRVEGWARLRWHEDKWQEFQAENAANRENRGVDDDDNTTRAIRFD